MFCLRLRWFLCFFSVCCLCGVEFSGFWLVAGGVFWFCGLLGVSCVCGVCLLVARVFVVVLFFFCWFCFVLGCPLFCGPPGVGVAPVVFRVWLLFCLCCSSCWCSGWLWWLCCSVRFFAPGGVVVAPLLCCCSCGSGSWLLLCVAPSWCWFMRFLLSWWFLVVVGPPPLFLVRHDQARLCFSCGFNAECHPGWVAVWCFCSWRLCLWVVVCHPVGSSGSCFVYHVASWSLCCCSCFVSVVSDSSQLLYGVDVSFYCPVFVSVCVYCCVPCFSAWCCSCLLSMAVCSCLLSVHGCCWL